MFFIILFRKKYIKHIKHTDHKLMVNMYSPTTEEGYPMFELLKQNEDDTRC